jgi:hypothetical protein
MRVESAVEPTRSQNMTVSCRRSGAFVAVTPGTEPSAFLPAADPAVERGAPQSAQNFLPGLLSLPHTWHRRGNGSPQSPQNDLPSGLALPHRGQFISAPCRHRAAMAAPTIHNILVPGSCPRKQFARRAAAVRYHRTMAILAPIDKAVP